MRRHQLSRIIPATPEAVYEIASNVDNLPRWAAGLALAEVVHDGDVLLVESPMGRRHGIATGAGAFSVTTSVNAFSKSAASCVLLRPPVRVLVVAPLTVLLLAGCSSYGGSYVRTEPSVTCDDAGETMQRTARDMLLLHRRRRLKDRSPVG